MVELIKMLELIKNSDENGAIELKNKTIPIKLYKYFPLTDIMCEEKKCKMSIEENERRFTTLSENKIWFSNFNLLNDPDEGSNFYVNDIKLKKFGMDEDMISKIRLKHYVLKSMYFSSSFSTSFDNMPMWAHYGNNHKGFCVEYKVINPKRIFKVIYEKQKVDISGIECELQNIYNQAINIWGIMPEELFKRIDEDRNIRLTGIEEVNYLNWIYYHLYYLKNKSWQYESEYRLVSILPKEINGFTQTCQESGLKPIHIYTGKNCNNENHDRLKSISKSLNIGFM